jgi:HlyD family secretion protein
MRICKVGDKAKIRIIKTGIKTIPILRFYQALKKDVVITGPYNTVSKELNSGDKVSLITDKDKRR